MLGLRQCSFAQESNLGGERAKESIASSGSPWGFCTCYTSLHRKSIEHPAILTFVHDLLSARRDQNVLSIGGSGHSRVKLSVANDAKSAAKAMQLKKIVD